MTPRRPSTTVHGQTIHEPAPRRIGARLRMPLAAAIAAALVAIGLLSGQGKPSRGDDKASSKTEAPVATSQACRAFVSEIHRTLQQSDDRLIAIAKAILESTETPDLSPAAIPGMDLTAQSAEARYKCAKLEREAAELAFDEYDKGSFLREKAIAESGVQCARNEREKAGQAVTVAKKRLAIIRALMTTGSASALDMEYAFVDRVTIAELEELKAKFALEQAESRKKVLEGFTKFKTLKELMSEVEKAKSEELAKQAGWELEKSKLLAAKRLTQPPVLTDVEKRILSLVQRAFPIQEAIEAKRDQLVKEGKPDESLETALRDLMHQIESLGDQAAIEQAALRIAGLKRRIGLGAGVSPVRTRSAGRMAGIRNRSANAAAGEETPGIAPAARPSPPRSTTEAQQALSEMTERLVALADRVANDSAAGRNPRDSLGKLQIDAMSAQGKYGEAKLDRQVAEIAVIEYTEGTFRQDLAVVEGEIALAQVEIPQAREKTQKARERLERITSLSRNTVADVRRMNDYADLVAAAEVRERNAEATDTLKLAEAKKKILVEYIQPKRKKHLKAEVEKARAEELARQADWEVSKARVEEVKKTSRQGTPDISRKRIFDLIDRAIPLEEQLHDKLVKAEKAGKSKDLLHDETQDLVRELAAILDEGEAVWSAGELARLKPRMEAALGRVNPAAAK